jgi:hypothetical protein
LLCKEASLAGQRLRFLSERVADVQGIEAVHMIRRGRVRWLAKGDAVGQAHFITKLFGAAA